MAKCLVCKSKEHSTSGHVAGPSDIGRKSSGIAKKAKSEALKKKVSPEYEAFKTDWKSKHSISPAPSHSSWKQYYKNK